MKEIARLADRVARRYYEIPKEQRQRKMSDYGQFFFLCAEAVYAVPVGTDVSKRKNIFGVLTIVKHEFQEQLNRKSLKYNWHEADVTVLEGVFARGDRTRRESDRGGVSSGVSV